MLGLAAPAGATESFTRDSACEAIRVSLHRLAEAERREAFALELESAGGGATEVVVARLGPLVERTADLRKMLLSVRNSSVAADSSVEDCIRNGFRALQTAEGLASDVEEMLFAESMRIARQPEPLANGSVTPPESPHP